MNIHSSCKSKTYFNLTDLLNNNNNNNIENTKKIKSKRKLKIQNYVEKYLTPYINNEKTSDDFKKPLLKKLEKKYKKTFERYSRDQIVKVAIDKYVGLAIDDMVRKHIIQFNIFHENTSDHFLKSDYVSSTFSIEKIENPINKYLITFLKNDFPDVSEKKFRKPIARYIKIHEKKALIQKRVDCIASYNDRELESKASYRNWMKNRCADELRKASKDRYLGNLKLTHVYGDIVEEQKKKIKKEIVDANSISDENSIKQISCALTFDDLLKVVAEFEESNNNTLTESNNSNKYW